MTAATKDVAAGLVRKLHVARTGAEVTDLSQLQADEIYVACGNKKFKVCVCVCVCVCVSVVWT